MNIISNIRVGVTNSQTQLFKETIRQLKEEVHCIRARKTYICYVLAWDSLIAVTVFFFFIYFHIIQEKILAEENAKLREKVKYYICLYFSYLRNLNSLV